MEQIENIFKTSKRFRYIFNKKNIQNFKFKSKIIYILKMFSRPNLLVNH